MLCSCHAMAGKAKVFSFSRRWWLQLSLGFGAKDSSESFVTRKQRLLLASRNINTSLMDLNRKTFILERPFKAKDKSSTHQGPRHKDSQFKKMLKPSEASWGAPYPLVGQPMFPCYSRLPRIMISILWMLDLGDTSSDLASPPKLIQVINKITVVCSQAAEHFYP